MRFTCRLNMGFNLIILEMICLSDITQESIAARIDHYVDVFVCENFACVMTFESLMLMPFCLEKTSVRKWYLKVLAVFSGALGWDQVKNARITITHVCFIALTLAGSQGTCLNICLFLRKLFEHKASCSNSFLGTRQKLMHEKMCDPYNASSH